MQDTKFNSKLDLSKYYSIENLTYLYKVFPKIKQNISTSNYPFTSYTIDKNTFYQIILEKIKNYFEIKQAFIISDSISILLNDIESTIDKNKNKFLPLINNRYNKDTSPFKRCLSTKSNGKNKNNENIKAKTSYQGFDFEKEKNLCDINDIYLNLEKKEEPKIKMVHFMNEGGVSNINNNIKNKTNNIKKSNLKKSKKESNVSLVNTIDLNASNLNEPTSRTLDSPLSKIKTEPSTSTRNKSNGIKFHEKPENKISNNLAISFPTSNLEIKKEILYDKIKMNDIYNDINSPNFDIFDFSVIVGKGNVLPLIANYIFTLYNFSEFMDIKKFRNFCEKISAGYINTNYYHNCIHAGDIAHTCYIYFEEGGINEKIGLNSKSMCALYLSCICHDFKHPGLNNNFLIETKHPIAIKYNDASVLENMHISESFSIINTYSDCNIFEGMEKNDYKIFRKQMIECVLATDMANHKNYLDLMKNKFLKEDYIKTEEDNLNYMKLLVHSADISNPTKKFHTYYKWAKLIVEEFYYQGDKEKELGMKCSCDRDTVTLYKSQLGFIDYVIEPFYGLFVNVFPKLNFLKKNVEENRKKIKEMEDEENKKN